MIHCCIGLKRLTNLTLHQSRPKEEIYMRVINDVKLPPWIESVDISQSQETTIVNHLQL